MKHPAKVLICTVLVCLALAGCADEVRIYRDGNGRVTGYCQDTIGMLVGINTCPEN
jgi:hypothetical protein